MSLKKQYKEDFKQSQKEELKVELLSRNNKRSGLCADCVRAVSCSLSHNTEAAIWNCEDYDNEEPVAAEGNTGQTEKFEARSSKAVESSPGLCSYCIHKDDCSLRKVEGGVWHCEEYE